MSDLTTLRDHARKMAAEKRPVIARSTAERALWTQMADEIDAYLTAPTAEVDLFGELTTEPPPMRETETEPATEGANV